LLKAGLIDRLVVMQFPVILGRGKSIFDGSQGAGALKLVEHAVSDKGVVFAAYEPAGEVPIGSFADGEPGEQTEGNRA
jgi:dihydrofolate reductase